METQTIYRPLSQLETGAAWGPAERRAWRYQTAWLPPGEAGPPLEREESSGAGGLWGHFLNDPIPIPGTSQALQVRLGLWAYVGEDSSPLHYLWAPAVCGGVVGVW